MESSETIIEPIKVGCFQHKSRSITDIYIREGTVVRDSGKARLIKGVVAETGLMVTFWLPNFFIKRIIVLNHGTTFVVSRDRYIDIEERMQPVINTNK